MRSHAQPGRSPACKKAAVWFFDRGYKLPLLPAGSMTTTSFFCRKKALWPFPPITLPRPEPFVNPAPQILQLLCRAAPLCNCTNLSRCFSADSTLVPEPKTPYDYDHYTTLSSLVTYVYLGFHIFCKFPVANLLHSDNRLLLDISILPDSFYSSLT